MAGQVAPLLEILWEVVALAESTQMATPHS